jgi:hypothetical protein
MPRCRAWRPPAAFLARRSLELTRPHWDAAREALRIKDFKQTGEGIRVAIVRGRQQEEPVLEALSEPAHCARELAVDCVARPAGRRGMMRIVEDDAPRRG